jgi:hypothetical protein
MNSMKTYFPACVHGSTRYRNDNEPHLVKYTGEAHEGVCAAHQGVCMHTDSADITVCYIQYLFLRNYKLIEH